MFVKREDENEDEDEEDFLTGEKPIFPFGFGRAD